MVLGPARKALPWWTRKNSRTRFSLAAVPLKGKNGVAVLGLVEQLLGLDNFDRPLPPVHEQLGEPTARQSRILRNLLTLAPV